jgi:hypothetical protein
MKQKIDSVKIFKEGIVMAVVSINEDDNVRNGDLLICRVHTDQHITEFYRCIYLDSDQCKNNGLTKDILLVFNFENHYPKDNIFIEAGNGYIKRDVVIEAIKKKWDCETDIEYIENDNLVIHIKKK